MRLKFEESKKEHLDWLANLMGMSPEEVVQKMEKDLGKDLKNSMDADLIMFEERLLDLFE